MAVSPKSFFSTPIIPIVIAVLFAVGANLYLTFSLADSGQKSAVDAIPAAESVEQIPFHQGHDLRAAQEAPQGFLGIQITTVDARTIHRSGIVTVVPGVLVVNTLPDFSAYTSGFEQNDIITHVDGFRVTDSVQLSRRIAAIRPGTRIAVQILRDGTPVMLYPTVGAKPREIQQLEAERAARIERCRNAFIAQQMDASNE